VELLLTEGVDIVSPATLELGDKGSVSNVVAATTTVVPMPAPVLDSTNLMVELVESLLELGSSEAAVLVGEGTTGGVELIALAEVTGWKGAIDEKAFKELDGRLIARDVISANGVGLTKLKLPELDD
jgi:hypothetical protein